MTHLLQNISQKKKENILQKLEAYTIKYKKRSVFIAEDKSFGVVLKGCVQIIKNDYNGNRFVIDEFYENSVFETISIPNMGEEYEFFAKEDSVVVFISFDEILHKLNLSSKSYNQFLKNTLEFLVEQITNKNERVEILTQKTIRNKLLAYFKIMRQKINSNIIYLPMTFTELAEFLAIDRSAMNRELKHLKEEGFITVENKKIKLLYEV